MKDILQILLLGPLEIRGGAVRGWAKPGPKTQALLAYLAARPRSHTRSELYDLFCDNAEDPPAALRWHLNRIRRWIGSDVILAGDDRLQVNLQAASADCSAFEEILGAGLESKTVPHLAAAVDSFRADFLADLSLPEAPEFELWLVGERARFRRLYERGLDELIARHLAAEEFDAAIPLAARLLRSNPVLEQAHARLIWLYAKTGQRQAALEQYARCRELLRRELAVEPMPELAALEADIRAGRVGRAFGASEKGETAALDTGHTADLVGRETEWNTLARLWRSARRGRGAAAFLEAEAGGGKTRLAHEFIRSLGESAPSFQCWTGQCYESTRAMPYHPWIELLEKRLAVLDECAIEGIPPYWMEQLTRLLPSLAGRRGREPLPAPPTVGGEVEHLFAAVSDFLFRLSGAAPALIFLDDLQWADESSLRLYHYVARRVAQNRALLLGAFRPEEVEDPSELQTLLSDLRRGLLAEIRLSPLDVERVTILTAQLWPKLPEGYRPHVCTLLVKATGGNPLFVTEVLRELSGTADIPMDVPVPPTVHALIGRRLGKLTESGRQVLQAIAVLDMPAAAAQAQQIAARSEEETVAALEAGTRWGLLTSAADAHPARYDFSHDLVRETVLRQTGDARRRLLHRRAAEMLAAEAGSMPAASRPEAAARILHHATEGGVDPLILTWAPGAAEHAVRLHVCADALRAVDSALQALGRREAAKVVPADAAKRHRLELILSRIEILSQSGRHAEQTAFLQTASELLDRNSPPGLEAAFHLARAYHQARMSRYHPAMDSAQRAYGKYRKLKDPVHAARCLVVRSDAVQSLGDNNAAYRLLEEALSLFRAAGDFGGESLCLSQMGGVLQDLGRIEQSMEHLDRALSLAEEHGDLFAQATASSWLGNAWIYYYNVEKILFYAKETADLCRTLENEFKGARALCYYMISEYLRENWEAADTQARRIYDVASGMKDGWLEGWSAHFLGRIGLMRNDFSAAERWLPYARTVRERNAEAQNLVNDLEWLGRLSLMRGEPARALEYTSESVRRMEALRNRGRVWETSDVYLCHAEALAASGDPGKSKAFVKRAHHELMKFSKQIRDPSVRRVFLAAPPNIRLLSAWESGVIPALHP
jgi:DNA-binding SARP family transcriptional activator